MTILPPGTILQLMYLRDRFSGIEPGRFLEIGPGSGEVSGLFLELGWTGLSYDLESSTVERLRRRFSREIQEGRFDAKTLDFLAVVESSTNKVDLIVSCMVMEHLSADLEEAFMRRSSEMLGHGGLMIGLVPSSPAHWGIEDEIAGHYRRYTRDSLLSLATNNGWEIRHIAGLTYPVSNFLFPLSNFLVRRAEKSKLSLSKIEKTKASGGRNVRFKTTFPNIFSLVLNRYVLLPLHWIQKVLSYSDNSLVLYFEAVPSHFGKNEVKNGTS
jgi:SAM-dependent methyltransferase